MTAQAMQEDRQRCLAVGMDGYLSKPLVLKELQGVLASRAELAGTRAPDVPKSVSSPQ
jgi:CheY-like chemotaxis protein